MRAIVQSSYGPPSEVLRLGEVERPALKADEVLVRVRATAVHADLWHSITGRPYSWRLMTGLFGPKHPVPGTDIAGVVEAVGARVTRFQPGDAVFGATTPSFAIGNHGGFAEYAAAPAQSLALKPASVSFEQAASVAASGYIAYSNLIPAGTDLAGKRALVNGAGGGVGTLALQMLKARGAHVTAVDAATKLDLLCSLGADEVIDYTRTNFLERVTKYDVILDIASNLTLEQSRPALNPSGLYLWIGHEHYGRSGGGALLGTGFPQVFRNLMKSVFGDPNLPKMQFPPVIPKLDEALENMRQLMAEGKLTPYVESYPLESFVEAFRVMESGDVRGKGVLVP